MTPAHPSDPPLRAVATSLGPVHLTDEGAGPVVLALHGVPGSHRDFRWLAPALRPELRLVRPDLPGFGATPLSTLPGRTAPERARLVPALLDALEIERCVLLGHSMGNIVAIAAAGQVPDRVSGLVVLSSPGARPHRMYRRISPRLVSGLLDRRLSGAVLRRLLPWAFTQGGFPRGLPPASLEHTLHCVATLDFAATGEAVQALDVPALVAWARDDPMIEPDIFEAFADLAPGGPRVAFDTGGHNIQKTHAVELGAAIGGWVRGLDASL